MKITPIHEELWGALNIITNHMDMAIATVRSRNTYLIQANELLKEYATVLMVKYPREEKYQPLGIPKLFSHHTENLSLMSVC